MLQLFKISGDSLYPLYKDGQRVVCRKVFRTTSVRVNDTVVFEKGDYGMMIKNVSTIDKDNYYVKGTDPFSIDSRNFGYLKKSDIKYKVLFKF